MSTSCSIGTLLCKESDCNALWMTTKTGVKQIVTELTSDDVYVLLMRTGCVADDLNFDSTICYHHENLYLLSDKFFNAKNDKCCNPFETHESSRIGKKLKQSKRVALADIF